MIKKQASNFSRARSTLIAVFIVTLINFVLDIFGADFYLVYSAFVPQVIFQIAQEFNSSPIGLTLALASASTYFICWIFSEKRRVFIMIAMILFSVDSFFLLIATLSFGVTNWIILDITIRAWILFCLISGTVAWVKLGRVTPEELTYIKQTIAQEKQTEELKEVLNTFHLDEGGTLHNDAAPIRQPSIDTGYPSIILDNCIKDRIIDIYKRGIKVDKFFMFDEVVPQKLQKAINIYAPSLELSSDETIIFHYDDTAGKSAKQGFILTTKRLYSGYFGSVDFVNIQNINEITASIRRISHKIIIKSDTRSDIELYAARSKSQVEALYNVLNRTIELLKRP